MEGGEVIIAEFPTVVAIDQRFKFVLEAKVEVNEDKEPLEQVISIKVVSTDIGKLKKYSMLDIKIKLNYFEPQSEENTKAVLSIEPAYSIFDKKLLFIAGG
jgi:hypothetical protein